MIITKFRCFTRNWWVDNPTWPNGLEPANLGETRKTYRATFASLESARAFCQGWNKAHNPGKYSNKCEFEEIRKRGKYNVFLGREI